jgi:predicted alpha/beta-hydrolase family hydrolase
MSVSTKPLKISLGEGTSISGLLQEPGRPLACCVLAHGAGGGMTHPFMVAVAEGLAERRIATLRYQFPYMERGSKRPDAPGPARATVRAAVAQASSRLPELPLFAGGKSFGGRMTSQAQAELPLQGVRGLVFLGFPLHLPGRPSDERGEHLSSVSIPMLFLQGTRDEFADSNLLEVLVDRIGAQATLRLFPDADHSFHVPRRSGHTAPEILADLVEALSSWIEAIGSYRR